LLFGEHHRFLLAAQPTYRLFIELGIPAAALCVRLK
jgi:hypothetical protein